MSRGKMDVTTRLERQEKKILKMSEELEKAKEEYMILQEEKEKGSYQKRLQRSILRVKER
jgi:hypothetical protein